MKSKGTATILALLLGGIGIHHFYLGNTGRGLIYLLFFRTGVPAIIAFIEFLNYLFMSKKTFDRRYNNG